MDEVDLLVVGGGVNGAGIARDAAGRGLRVLLCEAGDLAGATSSASSKLIHGGLRYLEQFAFRLVRESLTEREILLAAAPHIIWPMRFVLPHHKGLRPAWLLRLGLFLYDHIGGRKHLPATTTLDLRTAPAGKALKPAFVRGFEYSDCWVQDARLVVLTALDAQERGATILVRTALTALERDGDRWRATLSGPDGNATVRTRALVNAAGPWVGDVLRLAGSRGRAPRLVKGSHIVVPRIAGLDQPLTCQGADGRIIFLIPYERDYTLIGTTDVPFSGDPRSVAIAGEEITYLCALASEYLAHPVQPSDVVWTYAGVRPLYDSGEVNASAVTRDYAFHLEGGGDAPVLLSVYGGKLTTFRRLADHALRDLGRVMPVPGQPWTRHAILPGGDMPDGDVAAFRATVGQRWPWLPGDLADRLVRSYGARIDRMIGTASALADLGRDFGAGLTEAELAYLGDVEWARTAEDVLWRRSKLGLRLTDPAALAAISDWMATRYSPPARATGRSAP